MADAPLTHISWNTATRLIESKYPPIDLFEDIADPEDWELLAAAEGESNPRLSETVGQLDLVPPERRVSGPGASYVMAPFVHCSPDRPGRFHDGNFGVYYAADCFETALAETMHHQTRRLTDSADEPGWISDMRELVGSANTDLLDIRSGGFEELLQPDDYSASQRFAIAARANEANGIVYPSVRQKGGECIAAFWPDVVDIPVQGRHIGYHWNGERIDYIRELTLDGSGPIYAIVG